MSSATASGPRYRPMRFGVTRGVLRAGAGGVQYLRADQPLEAHAARGEVLRQRDALFRLRPRRQPVHVQPLPTHHAPDSSFFSRASNVSASIGVVVSTDSSREV